MGCYFFPFETYLHFVHEGNTCVTKILELMKGMKTLKTSGRKHGGIDFFIDDEDFERVSQYKWNYNPKFGYITRTEYVDKNHAPKVIYLHRFIMETPQGMDTDHINGNKLDNRRDNLRVCTRSQNLANRGKLITNSTGYKGVTIGNGKYVSQIGFNGNTHRLGSFDNPVHAALAYDDAAIRLFGDFAQTNFTKQD